MCARPVLLEFLRQAFSDQVNRQSGSVRRDNRAGFPKLRDPRQQIPLNLQIFRNNLDNPIRLSAPRQIILEIPDSDPLRRRCREECRRLRFSSAVQTRAHNLVPRLQRRVRRYPRRHNVQQDARQSRVREVRRDPRPHRPRPQHDRLLNSTFHREPLPLTQTLPNRKLVRKLTWRTGYKTSIRRSNNRASTCNSNKLYSEWPTTVYTIKARPGRAIRPAPETPKTPTRPRSPSPKNGCATPPTACDPSHLVSAPPATAPASDSPSQAASPAASPTSV